jgi:hypothetical protein
MTTTELRGPKQIEDAAIEFVIEREREAGRKAHDTRREMGAVADLISGDRVIEVKAYGTSSRGNDLWLECSRYIAAKDEPDRFWVYLVENVAHGDPAEFRLLRLGGEQLQKLLERAKEQRYWTVPVPVAVYDQMAAEQG